MKGIRSDTIQVHYEGKPSYNIIFSHSFQTLADQLRQFNTSQKKVCIITDSNVAPLYAEELKTIIDGFCDLVVIHMISAGKSSKNLDTVNQIYQTLVRHNFERSDMLIALGGGVVGDITGFTASTYLRGIDFIQVPTTLLSQVDSSIGGKTGVDFHSYKNIIGSFYMPRLVYMNISTLSSLNQRDYIAGMGEIIKYGLIKDKQYYVWLKEHRSDILSRDFQTLKKMLFQSCNIKRIVVENDPKEYGERALLNYGHTVGHAIERQKNFTLLHGECVSLGICASAYLSMKLNQITSEEYQDILHTLSAFHLPIHTSALIPEDVIPIIKKDKKMEQKQLKYILLKGIGYAHIHKGIDDGLLIEAVQSVIQNGGDDEKHIV